MHCKLFDDYLFEEEEEIEEREEKERELEIGGEEEGGEEEGEEEEGEEEEDNNYILGIDLGTTNSSAAIIINKKPILIPNEFGLLSTPSYVTFLGPNKRIVGQMSKLNIFSNKNTFFNSKRLIGQDYSTKPILDIKEKLPFIIKEDEKTKRVIIETDFISQNGDKICYYPEEISAIILKKIKHDAEKYIRKKEKRKIKIEKVVITTPAYFNQYQRRGTKQAAEIAGLEVIGMINEPTAAALAFGLYEDNKVDGKKKIIVLDFGGGTLDFTLLRFYKDDSDVYCDIECSYGNHNFGGEDFDNILMDHILKKNNINNIDEYQKLRLKLACEKAKIELSREKNTKIHIGKFSSKGDIDEEITREKFEEICENKFNDFKAEINNFVEECNLKDKILINDIILIGGTTKIPKIEEIVEEEFPYSTIRFDKYSFTDTKDFKDSPLSVAKGAAIFASMITNPKKYYNIHLFDVTNFSIRTNVFSEEKNKVIAGIIIKRYTQLTANEERTYGTYADNQTSILNNIYEGESEEIDKNLFLGTFKINNLPKRPKGEAKIKLILTIDKKYSLLEATAIDLSDKSNFSSIKLELHEPNGIKKEIFEKLKEKENKSETIEYPSFNEIKNYIKGNQLKSDSLKENNDSAYFNYLIKLFSLVPLDSHDNIIILEKNDSQLYFSFIKYIFNFAKEYFKNNCVPLNECKILKEKFMEIFNFIRFLSISNNDSNKNIGQNNEINNGDDITSTVRFNHLFKLLNKLAYNNIIYQYCLTTIVDSYNSIMKEKYFESNSKPNYIQNLKECESIRKTTLKLINKIKIPSANMKEIINEIIHYELKIEIQQFLLDYKYNVNSLEYDKDFYKNKAQKYEEEIRKKCDCILLKDERNRLRDIAHICDLSNEKMKTKDDMKFLYELVKFFPPKRKLLYEQIKTEDDIKEELRIFINKYGPNNEKEKDEVDKKEKEKEDDVKKERKKEKEILENKELNKVFISIFKKKKKYLINAENKSNYIKKRTEEEKEHKEDNDKYFNNFNKYCNDYAAPIRQYFYDDPYKTLSDLIGFYENEDNHDQSLRILKFLKSLKKDLDEFYERIQIIFSKTDLPIFFSIILEDSFFSPPKFSQKEKYKFSFMNRDDKELNSKIESFENTFSNSDSYDDKQTFECFKIIYDIYKISYYKTHERKYLAVLARLNKIKKDFEKKQLCITTSYDKYLNKILYD